MASNFEDNFQSGDSGAADISHAQCSKLGRKALIVIDKGRNDRHACQIVEVTTSKPGKHGSAKAHIIAMDVFTNKKYDMIAGTKDNVEVPILQKEDDQLVMRFDGDWFTIMNGKSCELEDVQLAPKLKEKADEIKQIFDACEQKNEEMQVSVWKWGDKCCVCSYKIVALE